VTNVAGSDEPHAAVPHAAARSRAPESLRI
jgi:hypothetical protein